MLQQIQTCQEIIQHSPLGKLFRPYRPNQVHGAIVGMEKLEDYEELFNANIWHAEGVHKRMDFTRLVPTVRQHLPMKIQFGGFSPDFDAFRSFGRP